MTHRRIFVNNRPVFVTYHYEPQDEYGNPGYYEIHKIEYRGVDIWPVYPDESADIIINAIISEEVRAWAP